MSYKYIENEPMSRHTTFKTGGVAKSFYQINDIGDLKAVMKILSESGEKPLIIGNGSNLLISDKGIDRPVIDMRSGFDFIEVKDDIIHAGAGAILSKVSTEAYNNSLSGLEFAHGIPGTVGGAVYMNAGAYGGEIKDVAVSVDALIGGDEVVIPAEEMDFSYRHSKAMEEDMIITGVTLKLNKGSKEEIKEAMDDFTMRRKEKQPLEYPSAGSTFKRPEGYFAGKLIMDSGLAGLKVGGAMVSPKHCGFIINYDNASSTDIYNLICKVQEEVYSRFGVKLEPEVKMIGDFS
ncbi:MAG: UDP-N-acetylmuramate dehydrogenase [Eubacterium sp.]|nr:UDP-N-acetylmuramate dehydrogenase [Eubacterium sp.]